MLYSGRYFVGDYSEYIFHYCLFCYISHATEASHLSTSHHCYRLVIYVGEHSLKFSVCAKSQGF